MSSAGTTRNPIRRGPASGPLLRGGCAALALLAAALVAGRWPAARPVPALDELAAFPSGRALPCLRLGHPSLMADIAWLRAIQYYGRHRMTDRSYPHAELLFRIITGLDPSFEQAYIFGALVLAEDAGRAREAEELLARGMAHLPESWWIAFERGFLRMVHLERPGAGARDMERASRIPGSPPWVARMAAWSYERGGQIPRARGIWRRIARETTNPMIREMAERALERLEERAREGAPLDLH